MTQFMSVEVTAEMFADLMAEDPNFAFQVWETLAERLNMGAMADDLGDLLAGCTNPAQARWIIAQFNEVFARIESVHFSPKENPNDR
jgi:hypothetical protein